MSTPIKREDIKKGDRIRVSEERTAAVDYTRSTGDTCTYELIERPVTLPTELGTVIGWDSPYVTHVAVLTQVGQWTYYGGIYTPTEIAARIADTVRSGHAFSILSPVHKVAAEVLAEVRHQAIYHEGGRDEPSYSLWEATFSAIATKFGVTK